MSASPGRSSKNKWIALLGLWALHGVIAFWQFITFPSNKHVFLFEIFPQRLLMGGFFLFWIILNLTLIVFILKSTSGWVKWLGFLGRPCVHDTLVVMATLMILFRVGLMVLMGLFSRQLLNQYGTYIDRLAPAMNMMTYISLEILALILLHNLRNREGHKNLYSGFIARIIIVLAVLGLTAAVISLTGLGIMPAYKGDWGRGVPAVPLLEWQIILACLFCLGMVVVESTEKFLSFLRLDLWIVLLIWSGAVVLWFSQPVVPSPLALNPREPNFEIYPFNDPRRYDEFSQSVLIGNGFGHSQIPPRPLYIVFLVLMHVLTGQGYNNMIFAQTLLLAVFPVLLYLFGKEFFGRPIGISIALLAILRDYTSNLVSPIAGNLSYSKVYLSEIPTAILLILFLLIGIRWIKAGLPVFSGFLMGGVLGLAMLIRTQTVVAFPVIILFALIARPGKTTFIMRGALLMFLAIALAIGPWLWRNWQIAGKIIFDNPESQTVNLAFRYSRLNNLDVNVEREPGESITSFEGRLRKIAFDAVSANPARAAMGVSNYFLNHAVNNILLFPLRNNLQGFAELGIPSNAFWQKWEGRPTVSQGLLLVFYVVLFGLGLATAWHRNGWLGFLPLCLNLAYNLWTSLALLSGQRFMVAMDWSVYLYYMIGLFTLLSGFLIILENGRSIVHKWYASNPFSMIQPAVEKNRRSLYILTGLVFLVAGASVPLSELFFLKRYPPVSQDRILNGILAFPSFVQSDLDPACLQKLVGKGQLNIVQGRALYPRYYEAGDGESFTDANGYKIVDQGRLVFEMVGQTDERIIVPMSHSPDFFPNASDVTILSNRGGDVWFVLVSQGSVEKFYISASFDPDVCE